MRVRCAALVASSDSATELILIARLAIRTPNLCNDRFPLPPGRRGLRGDLELVVAARARPASRGADDPRGGRRRGSAHAPSALAALWPDVRFAVGVHPHQAHEPARPPGRPRHVRRGARCRRESAHPRHRRDRARLSLRLLAARRAAGRVRRAGRASRVDRRCRSSSTRARPTTTPFAILEREGGGRRRAACSTASPATCRRRSGRSTSGSTCRLPASSTFPQGAERARRRRASCRATGCWPRPTARSWRRCRTAASGTSRRGSRAWSRQLAEIRGSDREAIDASRHRRISSGSAARTWPPAR